MSTTRVYESANGDTWELIREGAAHAYVRHTPNLSSGGKASQVPLDDFLRLQPHSPEHRALVAVLGTTDVAAPRAEPVDTVGEVKGYIHDPKVIGGPYIAVVLHAGKEPAISLHKSYAEAERELKDQLAAQPETMLSHTKRDDNLDQK